MSRVILGAHAGMLFGVVIALLIGAFLNFGRARPVDRFDSSADLPFFVALLGAGAGAIVGAIAGATASVTEAIERNHSLLREKLDNSRKAAATVPSNSAVLDAIRSGRPPAG